MCSISTRLCSLVKLYFDQCIDKNDDGLPNVICSNCQKIVHEYENGIFSKKIEIFDHSKLIINSKQNTRSSLNKTCSCTICLSQLSFNFNNNNGVPKIKKRNSSGRPKIGISDFEVSKNLFIPENYE
ncbi:hypothetical protein A3Q56_08748 [Intoshia linei]|uniref:Uncharacterized protein n=1 Tax=Intoshia linei TaxID=1819745 RepID=A0A177AQ90_9BILA|nr:hypothetical protein A3Q56_08748 [Intoshia linei]